ncbi:MAG: prepilin-type N-terminal cleavage/methylation domain-containing protein [Synergistaceae bacterium]|nr:prepilin-type N-terminal cleavage/methylation domain-containing protein [Synergistaceae bacterium]
MSVTARRGFSFIELSIAILVSTILMTAIATALTYLAASTRIVLDSDAALTRAETVFAILRHPAEHCGYGMPKEPEKYKLAFNSGATQPFTWEGPISVTYNTVGRPARLSARCRLVYGIATNIRTNEERKTSDPQLTPPLTLNGNPSRLDVVSSGAKPASTKNWLLFGSMLPECYPLWLSGPPQGYALGTLLPLKWVEPLAEDIEILIPENDEAFYLQAMECEADTYTAGDFVFFTNDHTGSGRQPRVFGVIDARFELAAGNRLLRVFLITRGNFRYENEISTQPPRGWPDRFPTNITDEARHYKLYMYTASFELKNL